MKNKKALSEMVAYVLLIVIALSIASVVYFSIKGYLPSQNEREKCSEEVSMIIKDYNCQNGILNLVIKNQGFFDINGFFILASNISGDAIIPNIQLTCTNTPSCPTAGRYDIITKLKNEQTLSLNFNYSSFGSIKRIQVQPFTLSSNNKVLLCENIIGITLEGC